MGRIAIVFLFLAFIVTVITTPFGDRSEGGRNQAHGRWPTFDADLPRKPAIPLSFSDLAGNTHYLSEFEGEVLLVNLWATWCAPCRAELPSLLRLQQTLSGQGFRLIMIATDRRGAEVVGPFLAANDLGRMRTYLDPDNEASARFGTNVIPTTILFDRSGREIGRYIGAVQWDNSVTVDNIRQILWP